VAVTYVLYYRIRRQLARPQTAQIVASAKPLEAGTQLAAEDLMVVEWPVNLPIEGAALKTNDVVGRILLYPVAAKEPIRESIMAGPGAAIGLTAKIPDGMRAVAVVTSEVNNVSGFLFPGSHVDVLLTFHPQTQPQTSNDQVTTTVLQNIQVISTGERLQPDPSGKPQNVKVITLLMTPDDAQKLLLASNSGTVQFVLRNAEDQQQVDRQPTVTAELIGHAAPKATAPKGTRANAPRTAALPKPTIYEVEVFDGTKRTVVKF
jgi:pilus assembly protein CpaB